MQVFQVLPTSLVHKFASNNPNMENSLYNPFNAYLCCRKNSFGQKYAISMQITFLKVQNVSPYFVNLMCLLNCNVPLKTFQSIREGFKDNKVYKAGTIRTYVLHLVSSTRYSRLTRTFCYCSQYYQADCTHISLKRSTV